MTDRRLINVVGVVSLKVTWNHVSCQPKFEVIVGWLLPNDRLCPSSSIRLACSHPWHVWYTSCESCYVVFSKKRERAFLSFSDGFRFSPLLSSIGIEKAGLLGLGRSERGGGRRGAKPKFGKEEKEEEKGRGGRRSRSRRHHRGGVMSCCVLRYQTSWPTRAWLNDYRFALVFFHLLFVC